jgi:hypothetical protein
MENCSSRATREVNMMLRLNHLLVALVVAMLAVVVTAAASAAPPSPTPGEPSCPGLDTASFAQDWKSFSFEPPGVAPLVKFYGGTNPTDFTQSGRYADCATP